MDYGLVKKQLLESTEPHKMNPFESKRIIDSLLIQNIALLSH